MSGQHARRSPSGAERWMNCPGSVVLLQGVESQDTEYSREGTDAHTLGATCLQQDLPTSYFENGDRKLEREDGTTFAPDDEMIEYVQVYVDEVRRRIDKGTVLMVEQRVDPARFTGSGENAGTADAVLMHDDGTWEVHDLKYGKGVVVDAEDNPQLLLYALGVLATWEGLISDPVKFKLVIHQPRRDHLDEWEVSIEELLAFADKVKFANQNIDLALAASDPENFLNPTDKGCRWCDAKATCPALGRKVFETVFDDFDDLSAESVKPVDDLPVTALPREGTLKLIDEWVAAARARITALLNAGQSVPGWKLIKGRKGNRAWSDENEVTALVKKLRSVKTEDAFDTKLKSPAQLEKVVPEKKWRQFEGFITQADGQPKAVDVDAKGDAVDVTPTADKFDLL